MRHSLIFAALCSAVLAQTPLAYPETRKLDVVDTYFGVQVADPYRWLEDDHSLDTRAWVEAENRVTFGFLEQIPARQAITDRLGRLWNYEKYSVPFRKGGHLFYFHNTGLQNQSVLMVTDKAEDPGQVLLDPNALSKEGTAALSGLSVTHDGARVAYAISKAGSDWQLWKVRDVATGQDLPDAVQWVKDDEVTWLKGGGGFYYCRFAEPRPSETLTASNQNQKLYFHKLGTDQAQDQLIYERPDHPDWYLNATVTDDGRWLVLRVGKGDARDNAVLLQDLSRPGSALEPLLDRFDATYDFVDNEGDRFFLRTNQGAPRYCLVAVQRGRTEPAQWQELIPQNPQREVLESVARIGGQFVATWMKDAASAVTLHGLDGKKRKDLPLPGLGTASGFNGTRDDTDTFYQFSSYTQPGSIYRYDLRKGRSTLYRSPKVAFDPSAFETEQVFYPGKDGTKIPMFLVHRKGLVRNGQNPTLLYGYGGFGISLTPWFAPMTVEWLEMGGVYAVANLRGGGEYGTQWYDAGKLAHKQNVFDDFIAAGEWLIANKVTSTPKLAIHGGSNGGLLVGACLTQRPDLWGAAVPEVGVMDMLRFHKFTVGFGWKCDYGSSETQEGFDTLIRYSPLHALKPGTRYPATLVTTGDHDDRVVPAHSEKFAATLQADQAGPEPVLIRIETDGGHGAGKPTAKRVQASADILAFLTKALKMKLPEAF